MVDTVVANNLPFQAVMGLTALNELKAYPITWKRILKLEGIRKSVPLYTNGSRRHGITGFDKDDLAVTVEDNQLIIRGKQADDQRRAYLHRGIAARQFQKNFVLALGIEVIAAELGNGLLYIELARPKPSNRVRTIEITSAEDRGG